MAATIGGPIAVSVRSHCETTTRGETCPHSWAMRTRQQSSDGGQCKLAMTTNNSISVNAGTHNAESRHDASDAE